MTRIHCGCRCWREVGSTPRVRWRAPALSRWLFVCLALILGGIPCGIADSTTQYDGRLIVLDQYYQDGSHGEKYLLMTAADQLLSLQDNEILASFQTNDVVRVWLAESSNHSRRLQEGHHEDTEDGFVVTAAQQLSQDWLIPGDAAQVYGDASFWSSEDDEDESTETPDTGSDTGSKRAAALPRRPSVSSGELTAVLAAESLSKTVSVSAQGLSPPYAQTMKVVSDMSMLVYVLDLCGKGGGPATTAQNWNSTMLGSGLMGNYVSSCSGGVGFISPSNSKVVDIKLGCSGVLESTGDTWTATSCSGDNLMKLAYAADEYAQWQLGINPRKYRHHVMLLPAFPGKWMGSKCNWAGTAVVGFAAPAWTYMWVAGEVWNSPQLYLHEMGHNYMLGHSSLLSGPPTTAMPEEEPASNVLPHGDWSSAMGYCCSLRCFNAPHSWQMGWAQALAVVDKTQLSPGTTVSYFLPPRAAARRSFVTVTTNWVSDMPASPPPAAAPPRMATDILSPQPPTTDYVDPPPRPARKSVRTEETVAVVLQETGDLKLTHDNLQPPASSVRVRAFDASAPAPAVNETFSQVHTFWLSWRPALAPYDLPNKGFADGLLIHLYDGTAQSDTQESFFQARLQPGPATNVWADRYYGSGLVVRLLGAYDNGASVTVCRQAVLTENTLDLCTDGLDNDCNGLADAMDPACAAILPTGTAAHPPQPAADIPGMGAPPNPPPAPLPHGPNRPATPLKPPRPPPPPKPRPPPRAASKKASPPPRARVVSLP